jgi:hypothetical protein
MASMRDALLITTATGWLLLMALLVWWAFTCLLPERRYRARAGDRVFWVVLGLIILQVLDAVLWSLPKVDWRPSSQEHSNFHGTYSDGRQTITFHRHGGFKAIGISGIAPIGIYSEKGGSLYLDFDGGSRHMRHIVVEGKNHVLLEEIGDLDGWNGEVGLPQVSVEPLTPLPGE